MTPTDGGSPRRFNQATAGRITVPITMAINKVKMTWLKRYRSQKPTITEMSTRVAHTTRPNVQLYG